MLEPETQRQRARHERNVADVCRVRSANHSRQPQVVHQKNRKPNRGRQRKSRTRARCAILFLLLLSRLLLLLLVVRSPHRSERALRPAIDAMNTIRAIQEYIWQMLDSVPDMKVLVMDQDTVRPRPLQRPLRRRSLARSLTATSRRHS